MPIFYSPVPDDISTGLAYVGTSVLSDHVRSERCDLSPSRADVDLLQPLLPTLVVSFLCLHAGNQVRVPSRLLPGSLDHRNRTCHHSGASPTLPWLLWKPRGECSGTILFLRADVCVPVAHIALLRDGRGFGHPSPGARRTHSVPGLCAGGEPGRRAGAAHIDQEVDAALPPAPDG
ncbi:transmembrane protein 17A isoform X4 [Corythoichthys intestinalis]|uniref:transmembrane protein 17A isoform X4 n=1 Tax=Corythoichthys intestinalis TaxID=161448 RepID=UPI0025A5415B|nr:transmembrane protein 17A isoform X4 [Corythoichthys intestinalis]